MKIITSLFVAIMLVLPIAGANANVSSNTNKSKLYEMPRTQVVPIINNELAGQYELYVKLPQSYTKKENKDKEYPVIYFTDAVWSIEMLSAATEYLLEDVILVGISWQKDINPELIKEKGEFVSRFRDYSTRPSSKPEKQAKYQFGQASGHLSFIRNEVFKTIETNYRTDVNNRTYFGYSLGGLFGAYILSAQPDTFNNYIIGSPSLKKDVAYLTELEEQTRKNRQGINANVFISYGDLEHKLGKYVEEYITAFSAKKDKSLVMINTVVKGDHSQAFPITGISAITWLAELIKLTEAAHLAKTTALTKKEK